MLYASYFQPVHYSTPVSPSVSSLADILSSRNNVSNKRPEDNAESVFQTASSYHTVGEGPSTERGSRVQEKRPILGERRQRTSKAEDDYISPQELRKLLVETRQALTIMQAEHSSLRLLLECLVYRTAPPPRFKGPNQAPVSIGTQPVVVRPDSQQGSSTDSESDASTRSHLTSDFYSDKDSNAPPRSSPSSQVTKSCVAERPVSI